MKRARSRVSLAQISSLVDPLQGLVECHKAGARVGIASVCSAHPLVLEAAMTQARHTGATVLVEATSNQVDQFGGYTGLRPADFARLVHATARACGVPTAQVVLGGDHLGPNRWRGLAPESAMANAQDLIAAYVRAGFTKLHLDCSMPCAGDPRPLGDELASARAAQLMRSAEHAAGDRSRGLCYVIGTEVPVPGGALEAITELVPTSPQAALDTLAAHRAALARAGLQAAWPRIRALVVQPGVEFDEWSVAAYRPERTVQLQRVLETEPGMVFEAHSTDYQTAESLAALVADHWAILKVGPGLTFALREALFALAAIEDQLVADGSRSRLIEVLDERMLAERDAWEPYYHGDAQAQRVARRYSFSDRLRYYWPDPAVRAAQQRLLGNLEARDLPLPLLSQHLPSQYARVREGVLAPAPRALAIDHVRDVLRDYDRACGVNEHPARAAARAGVAPPHTGRLPDRAGAAAPTAG